MLWCAAWGPRLETLKRYVGPSWLWEGNFPALAAMGVKRIHYRGNSESAPDRDQAVKIISELLSPFFEIDASATVGTSDHGFIDPFRKAVQEAHANGWRLFQLPPDCIWGNGSIGNLWAYARNKKVSIASAHLRVDEHRFCSATPSLPKPLTNGHLAELAYLYPHQSASSSWSDQDNSTMDGGISLGQLTPRLITCLHHLPTVHLAYFESSDVEFFKSAIDFGEWDQKWPAMLIASGRYRVMAGTDGCFMVELTHATKNLAKVQAGSAHDERHHRVAANNLVNSCIVNVLRRDAL